MVKVLLVLAVLALVVLLARRLRGRGVPHHAQKTAVDQAVIGRQGTHGTGQGFGP